MGRVGFGKSRVCLFQPAVVLQCGAEAGLSLRSFGMPHSRSALFQTVLETIFTQLLQEEP